MRKKRTRRLIGLGTLLFLAIAALVILAGFHVQNVTVSGNNHHSSEEISDSLMTNFLSENTLYLLWTNRNGEIPATMPYLDSLKISMKSPFSIEVQVTEKPLVGYLEDEENVYFDANGLVLEITDEKYDDLPQIIGISLGEVVLYQKVPAESSSQLRTVLNLLDLLNYYELNAQEIRFSENSEITVYIRHIDVAFGKDEYLEEKVANLNAVLKNISRSTAGILHLENVTGKYEDITFTPTGTVVEETEPQNSSLTGAGDTELEALETDVNTIFYDVPLNDNTTLGGTRTDGSTAGESANDSSSVGGDLSGGDYIPDEENAAYGDYASDGDFASDEEDAYGEYGDAASEGENTAYGSYASDGDFASDEEDAYGEYGDAASDEENTAYGGYASDEENDLYGDFEADEDSGSDEEDAVYEEYAAEEAASDLSSGVGIMVFNSYGQLVYNVHVQNGMVVDAYGNEVPGCSINENGYVVDAYMNIIDPATGDLMN